MIDASHMVVGVDEQISELGDQLVHTPSIQQYEMKGNIRAGIRAILILSKEGEKR